ncbi:hypothetical protein CspHIS471_0408020 [Cutaneotrichosporon sp. HIS471]|nr:hypothetical protein CspHIS471_0408020 [Cutaneotrichosporon sp. HIS471]
MAPHVHDKIYWVFIPINTEVVDGPQWDSLALTLANKLWYLGYAPKGEITVTHGNNEVVIPTHHPLNKDVVDYCVRRTGEFYDPHTVGPVRREESDFSSPRAAKLSLDKSTSAVVPILTASGNTRPAPSSTMPKGQHLHDKMYSTIIPVDSAGCDKHKLQDGPQWESLALAICVRLWHRGYAPNGEVVVSHANNEIVIPTFHPVPKDDVEYFLRRAGEFYDPHKVGPARTEEVDFSHEDVPQHAPATSADPTVS